MGRPGPVKPFCRKRPDADGATARRCRVLLGCVAFARYLGALGQAPGIVTEMVGFRNLADTKACRMVRAPLVMETGNGQSWKRPLRSKPQGACFSQSGARRCDALFRFDCCGNDGLRGKLRAEQGGSSRSSRTGSAKIALEGKGGDAAQEMFQGPVAIAFSPDPVAAPEGRCRVCEGQPQSGPDRRPDGRDGSGRRYAFRSLAKLPSSMSFAASLSALVQAPATKVAGVRAGTGRAAWRVCSRPMPKRTRPERFAIAPD